MVGLIAFAHRQNSDASIDSICTTCFQTIASEDSEGQLIAHEERHSCDPYWQFSRTQVDSLQSTPARSVKMVPPDARGMVRRAVTGAFPESVANQRRQPPEARPTAF
jgi:hypothetical protein